MHRKRGNFLFFSELIFGKDVGRILEKLTMLKANLIISLRSLKKHLVYTWVNVLGLSIALCSVFLTYCYTTYEWTYDQSFPDSERIYRLVLDETNESNARSSTLSYVHTIGFEEKFPTIQAISRNRFSHNGELVRAKKRYGQAFKEGRIVYAEAPFLTTFKPKMIQGDDIMFDQPYKVLLSQKMAEKYFGDEKAVGEIMIIASGEYEIIGVYEDFASNSSLRPEFLISMNTLKSIPSQATRFTKSGYFLFHTFVKLTEAADIAQLEAEMNADAVSRGLMSERSGELVLDPMEDYHFQTVDYVSTLAPKADEKLIVWLMAISIGLMLVAIVNFGNISLAIALSRTKEIAVRKIIGARKKQIIIRSLFESLLLCLIGFLIALILLELSLPVFSEFVDRELTGMGIGFSTYVVLFSITMGMGLVAGLYPAMLVSNFKVMSLFRTESKEKRSKFSIRNLLLSFQFMVTFVLLALTQVMNRQVNFLLSKDPGFDFENVVVFTPSWFVESDDSEISTLKDQLMAMPEVADIAFSDISPLTTLRETAMDQLFLKGRRDFNEEVLLGGVDCHFFDFYNIEAKLTSDVLDQLCEPALIGILNDKSIASFDSDITGKSFFQYSQGSFVYPIVQKGSVGNFHYTSSKEDYLPMLFIPMALSSGRNKFNIRLNEGADQAAFISKLNKLWWEKEPYEPFDLKVLEDEHQRVYSSEVKLQAMAGTLSLAVCIIAFAGVFALSIFYGKHRLKEIGIRKVLGASFHSLFLLQSRTFLIILLVSCLAAIPMVQWLADDWISQFASRVAPSNWVYPFTAITLVICTILSVGWYSSKVARVNPADIIRDH